MGVQAHQGCQPAASRMLRHKSELSSPPRMLPCATIRAIQQVAAQPDRMDIPGYRDFTLLAEGGMGAVYVAEQVSLQRKVAIKVLKQLADPALAQRFVNEGQIIASLNHRNIITIYDVGTVGGHNYISMEYLQGGDLERRIAEGIPVDAAFRIAMTIGTCLSFVHDRGIVHRDIKPANILFHSDGTPILTDFGVAKQQEADNRLTM